PFGGDAAGAPDFDGAESAAAQFLVDAAPPDPQHLPDFLGGVEGQHFGLLHRRGKGRGVGGWVCHAGFAFFCEGLGGFATRAGAFLRVGLQLATLVKALTCESCKVAKVALVARVGHQRFSASVPLSEAVHRPRPVLANQPSVSPRVSTALTVLSLMPVDSAMTLGPEPGCSRRYSLTVVRLSVAMSLRGSPSSR